LLYKEANGQGDVRTIAALSGEIVLRLVFLAAGAKSLRAEFRNAKITPLKNITQEEVDKALENVPAQTTGRPGWNEPWTPPKGWNGPVNHGEWTGPKGNSNWIDTRPEVIEIVGIDPKTGKANPIPFYQGEVDFSKWLKGELTVTGLEGTKVNSNGDMRKILAAIAEKEGLPNATAARLWLDERGWSPHHAGGDKVQLVPRDLHKVQHTDVTH
jgi:hypothetical protein